MEREQLNRWIVEECERREFPGEVYTVEMPFAGANVCVYGKVNREKVKDKLLDRARNGSDDGLVCRAVDEDEVDGYVGVGVST